MRCFVIAAGVVCLLLSIAETIGTVDMLRSYERVEGIILLHESHEGGQAVMRPGIKYTRVDGQTWGHSPKFGELPRGYVAGDKVTVLYKPKSKNSLIATPWMWAYPIAIGFAGALLTGVGAFALRDLKVVKDEHPPMNLAADPTELGTHSISN